MKKIVLPRMAISLPLAVLAALCLLAVNEVSFRQSTAAAANIEQAQQTRGTLNKLMQNLLDAETGQRGYLLTGDETYL